MKRIYFPLLFTFLLLTFSVKAQHLHQGRNCATEEYNKRKMAENPVFAQSYIEWQKKMAKISAEPNKVHGTRSIITIPVVVHILYKNAQENIPMSVVQSQIDVMNEDFRKLNADAASIPAVWQPIAGDFEIEFCLARKKPNGDTTSGVIWKPTTVQAFSINTDNIKYSAQGGDDIWDRNKYLNIWVGEITSGILGYAQFPGGLAAEDGVVIGTNCFGRINPTGILGAPYDLGRTVTHEVGHWLGLKHTWGDDGNACSGTDNIADTPNQAGQNFGCPTFPLTDACSPASPGVMFMNYMDYTDDACMYMFTNGQKAVSRALFDPGGFREPLLTSAAINCNTAPPPPLLVNDAGIDAVLPVDSLCDPQVSPSFVLHNDGNIPLTAVVITYNYDGGASMTYSWNGTMQPGDSVLINLSPTILTGGNHTLNINVTGSNGVVDVNATNNLASSSFYIITSGGPGQLLPFIEGFESGNIGTNGSTIINPTGGQTWQITTGAAAIGTHSIMISNLLNSTMGAKDDIVLPTFNFTPYPNPSMSFDYAYASYSPGASDTLEILVSNCGPVYTSLGKFYGSTLSTAVPTTAGFVPSIKQWERRTIDLTPYAGSPSVKIAFRNISGYENNLYLDNINILGFTVGVEPTKTLKQLVALYPNPATNELQIGYNAQEGGEFSVKIYDISGRMMDSLSFSANQGKNEWKVDVSDFANGIYIFQLENGTSRSTEKVIINK
jgi:hypothetical protein